MNQPNTAATEKVYYSSFQIRVIPLLLGIFCVVMAVFAIRKGRIYMDLALANFIPGVVAIVWGILWMRRKRQPVLKISEAGIWTAALGFIPWAKIDTAEIVEIEVGETVDKVLRVFLKRGYPGELPDEELSVTSLDDYYSIAPFIKKYKSAVPDTHKIPG